MDEPTLVTIDSDYFLKCDVAAARSVNARSGWISFARWNKTSSLSTWFGSGTQQSTGHTAAHCS